MNWLWLILIFVTFVGMGLWIDYVSDAIEPPAHRDIRQNTEYQNHARRIRELEERISKIERNTK